MISSRLFDKAYVLAYFISDYLFTLIENNFVLFKQVITMSINRNN